MAAVGVRFSRMAGVHVCQSGGRCCKAYFFPMLMEAYCSLTIISKQMKAEDPLRNSCYVVICCGVQSSV